MDATRALVFVRTRPHPTRVRRVVAGVPKRRARGPPETRREQRASAVGVDRLWAAVDVRTDRLGNVLGDTDDGEAYLDGTLDTQNWVRLDENGGAAASGIRDAGEEQEG